MNLVAESPSTEVGALQLLERSTVIRGSARVARRSAVAGHGVARLTPRQREVLALMAVGYSNAAIARRLVISEKAVVQHTSQIYERLDLFDDNGIHRRVHAVVQYLQHTAAA